MLAIMDTYINGDGINDNTFAIRQLLADLPASRTIKARIILSGVLLISETIVIPDYTILDIRGAVKLANNANIDLFRIGNVTTPGRHIDIRGGEIDGNRANQTAGLCVNVWPGEDVLIEDTYIHDAKEQNVRVFGGSKRVTVRNVRGVDGETGNIYFLHANQTPQPEIVDSTIEGCQLYYTVPSSNTANIGLMNARRISVIGNHCSGATDFGIHVEEHLYDSVIKSNIIHDHTQDGIRAGYSAGNVISGNVTTKNGRRGISLSQDANENVIAGNVARMNGWGGVVVEDGSYNLIDVNSSINNNQALHDTYRSGIQILSVGAIAPLYNTIRGNIATDTQPIKTQQYGISEGGTLANLNVIENNDVRGNALEPYNNIQRAAWGVNKTIVRNNIGGYNLCTFTPGDTTPSVAIDIGLFKTINTAPTVITSFDDGYFGQSLRLIIGDAFTTFDFTGTTLKGNANMDWSPSAGDWLEATYDGTNWYCAIHDCT